MKRLFLLFLLLVSLAAQQEVVLTDPTSSPPTLLFSYTGAGNVEYLCKAPSTGPTYTWSRLATTLTSIGVATDVGTVTTATAHGLAVGNQVTISGATVDTDLNGTYTIASVGSSVTFTITTSSVADGTYVESPLKVSTSAPRSSAAVWSIQKFIYDATPNLIRSAWAYGSRVPQYVCDDKANLPYN